MREARKRRDEARNLIANGTDPAIVKRLDANAAKIGVANTFKSVADEYIDKSAKEGRAAVTIGKTRWLLSLMERDIGQRPIAEITPAELLLTLRKVETKGHLETARRMRSPAGRVFRYAVATSRATADPASLLRGALVAPKVKHHSAILESVAVGALLRALDGYQDQPLTCLALMLTPHVFVRPGELRRAEWSEFDLDKAIWTIPADKMKARRQHAVPLSQQVRVMLIDLQKLTGGGKYVFPSAYGGSRPMSENTLNASFRRMGFDKDEVTAHGLTAAASTFLNECGLWSPDAIERALAHGQSNATRGA